MQVEDLLKDYPAFQQYSRNGLELELQFQKAERLPENVLDWAFTLCKSNMEEFYNGAWGWSDATKREELSASEARFLVAYTKVGLHELARKQPGHLQFHHIPHVPQQLDIRLEATQLDLPQKLPHQLPCMTCTASFAVASDWLSPMHT